MRRPRARLPRAAAALATLCLAITALSGSGTAGAADTPTRLWYRIGATVTATYKWEPADTALTAIDLSNSWSIESNTAVLLYRQCSHRERNNLTATDLALMAGLAPGASCAEVRRRLPRAARVHLVEDVRFKAMRTVSSRASSARRGSGSTGRCMPARGSRSSAKASRPKR